MRVTIYIISLLSLLNSCSKTDGRSTSEINSIDTIYSGDFIWREKKENKRLTVIFDNGKDGERPVLKLNEDNLLRIRVKRLFEYEVYPSDIKGAEIVKIDTAVNLFLVTPTDSSISFIVNQYYPKGRVVRYVKNWNEEIKEFEENLMPLNGFKAVTHFEWEIK
jgi:hypothetical protein